jgi:HSP20 family protein
MNELRRRMDTLFEEYETPYSNRRYGSSWPAINLYDNGESLVVYAAVPGLKEEDINITVQNDVITVSGERKIEVPEGYTVHRQERSTLNFSRSFSLPVKVDFEKTVATMKDGILTVMLPKSPEAQPRRISVTGS